MERTVVCTEESNGIKNKVKLHLFHLKDNLKLSNFLFFIFKRKCPMINCDIEECSTA